MVNIRKVFNKDNTRVLELLMFHENRKTTIFKVLGSVIYCIMDNYICTDYLCLNKYKISLAHKVFDNTTFNDISGIGILELLMNIMSFIWIREVK